MANDPMKELLAVDRAQTQGEKIMGDVLFNQPEPCETQDPICTSHEEQNRLLSSEAALDAEKDILGGF